MDWFSRSVPASSRWRLRVWEDCGESGTNLTLGEVGDSGEGDRDEGASRPLSRPYFQGRAGDPRPAVGVQGMEADKRCIVEDYSYWAVVEEDRRLSSL